MKREKTFPTSKPELIETGRNEFGGPWVRHYDEWLAVALYEAGRKPKGSEFTLESLFDPDLWEMIKRSYMIYRPFERDFDELVALTAGNIKRVDDKDGVPTYVNVKGPVKGGPIVVNPCCYLLWLTSLLANSLPFGTEFRVEDLWSMKFWKAINASHKNYHNYLDLRVKDYFHRCVKDDDPWGLSLIDLVSEVEIINYHLYKRNDKKGKPICGMELFIEVFVDLIIALGIDPEEFMDIHDVFGSVVVDNMPLNGQESWGAIFRRELRRRLEKEPVNVNMDLLYLTVVLANSLPKGTIFKVEDIFGHYKWVDHLWHKIVDKGYSSKLEAYFYGCKKDEKPYGLPLIDFHNDTSDSHTTEYVRNDEDGVPIDWEMFFTAFWNVVDALGFSFNDEGFIFGVYEVFDPERRKMSYFDKWHDEYGKRHSIESERRERRREE